MPVNGVSGPTVPVPRPSDSDLPKPQPQTPAAQPAPEGEAPAGATPAPADGFAGAGDKPVNLGNPGAQPGPVKSGTPTQPELPAFAGGHEMPAPLKATEVLINAKVTAQEGSGFFSKADLAAAGQLGGSAAKTTPEQPALRTFTNGEVLALPKNVRSLDPSSVPSRAQTARSTLPWSSEVPARSFVARLPLLVGWEKGVSRSQLPEGATLAKKGEKLSVDIPLDASKRVAAALDKDGKFTAVQKDGTRLAGRLESQALVLERLDRDGTRVAQWRAELGPRFSLVTFLEKRADELTPEEQARGGGRGRVAVAWVLSLLAEPLDIYLRAGEVITLPPMGKAALAKNDLDSPHLKELHRAGCIEIVSAK